PRRGKPLELLLANKIRTILPQRKGNSRPDSQTEFLSGRRRYLCRAFSFSIGSAMPHTQTAMCLERMILERLPSPGIAKQFCLTPRELETAELLVLGFANKEIAARISISPNTVKNFVRMIMVKMRVTSRSGIVARILGHGTPEPKLPGLPSLSDPRRSSGKRMED
ncbi:MAG TPA: LuxR C-terminal-related transcriptional regulator, partial [Terriglobales bacterium]|nr:LuxR C-terminal-related transcriptional regulator [Terriglobales bacterium]